MSLKEHVEFRFVFVEFYVCQFVNENPPNRLGKCLPLYHTQFWAFDKHIQYDFVTLKLVMHIELVNFSLIDLPMLFLP